MVDTDTLEMIGAWLATATALPPVVTKTYTIYIPVGKRGAHKRIAYANTWGRGRVFKLHSSNCDTAEVCMHYIMSSSFYSRVNEHCN